MSARILICIPCHNRKAIAEQCLPTMRDSTDPDDLLLAWNDGSTEYDDKWLRDLLSYYGSVMSQPKPLGIQAQRRLHLGQFLSASFEAFTHLYLTDHDILHDPGWRHHALRLQEKYDAPLCLYNTAAHADMPGNTKRDDPAEEVVWRHFAPGCSYLLARKHVEKIRYHIDSLRHFDWQIPALLGYGFATSRTSYCDHMGWGGERHPEGAGLDGGDRALHPTPWLVAKRAEVVAELTAQTATAK